jgi:Flp pilus assembly protein TadG
MNRRGQVLIVVAFLIPIALLLVAIAVDAGRIFIERSRMQRAAGAAANAGISVVSERIVNLAAARQTLAAPVGTSTAHPLLTATPPPGDPVAWLTDEDRATLVSPAVRSEAAAEAVRYLEKNGFDVERAASLEAQIDYPQAGYDAYATQITELSMQVQLEQRLVLLLVGLLNENWVMLTVDARSQIPQR